MSTQIFPSLPMLSWPVKRTPKWSTRKQESISGKRTTIADWSFPRWQWELSFEGLRQAGAGQQVTSWYGTTYAEFATLAGFFNARQGGFDSFLYADADDNTVVGQAIAVGDGSTGVFQMVRSFGGLVEPILAPNTLTTTNIYLSGVRQTSGYQISSWENLNGLPGPGILNIIPSPAAGVIISADFSFYFPCQFDDDTLSFEKFMSALYAAKSVKFSSLK